MKKIAYLYFLLSLGLFAQKRDPRSVAMAGATSTSADGIYAVGFNPGLIAFQKEKPFMLQLGGLDFGISNNYLSMAAMNTLSGDTLDSDEKSAIINRFQSRLRDATAPRHCLFSVVSMALYRWAMARFICTILLFR